MTVYQNNIRHFLKLFPREVLCSDHKDAHYRPQTSYHALNHKFIQYNSRDRINIIAVDIDHHRDGAAWFDHDLPQPTWTVFTDKGVQFMWVLNNPILLHDPYASKNMKYARDVLNKLVYALGADISAIGFNRVFRNPLKHDTHYSDTRVDLSDFSHLDTPSQAWWDVLKARTKRDHSTDTLFSDITAPVQMLQFAGMVEGDGRNVAMFDRLRVHAYDLARQGEYNEFDLAHRGFVINDEFTEPLGASELNLILSSIDRFMETKYNGRGGNYMDDTTAEERTETARTNGSKGGKVTAKVKQSEAFGRITATIVQMQSFDIKITVSDVARRAKSHPDTVRKYMHLNGWSNEGAKKGWKQDIIHLPVPKDLLSKQLF